ncbi:MAG: glycosyl transferase family 2 [Gammaproteobacteria bacterium]|nr:glycosyl transferase family 2 [Gammaproteobacteria bacterium]
MDPAMTVDKALAADPERTVCAVVVTWQPVLDDLLTLLDQLAAQACDVVVVDNGSANAAELANATAQRSSVTLVRWPDNRGLAAAMNAGLQLAQDNGYARVFLFDQDSTLTDGFCAGMQGAWQRAEKVSARPVAAVGPRLQDPASGRRTPFRLFRLRHRSDQPAPDAPDLYQADFLISSGCLLSLTALDRIGLMKESYFIDNIDLEWCFRARAQGFALFGTDAAVLLHAIGEPSANPLVRAGWMVQHSPLRSYYSTRNRLHLYRQDYAPLNWKLRDSVRFVLKSGWLLLCSAQRREYWRQIRRGMQDAGTLT